MQNVKDEDVCPQISNKIIESITFSSQEKTPSTTFKTFKKDLLKTALTEWDAVNQQENILEYLRNAEQNRLCGVKLENLQLDTSYIKFSSDKSDFEIKLNHNFPVESTAKAFRRGKLVDLLIHSKHTKEKWGSVCGIISKVDRSSIFIEVLSIGDNFLLQSFRKKEFTHVDLLRKSSSKIMEISAKAIKGLKLNSNNYNIASKLLAFEENQLNWQVPQVPIFCEKQFILDDDKKYAVDLCSNSNPITIIHGPPGTGKTTALASVIISAVANGSKVLATAPRYDFT